MDILTGFALFIGALRVLVVFDGLLFMVLRSGRQIQWDRSMKIAFPEPFLLGAAVTYVWLFGPIAPMAEAYSLLVGLGALLSLLGIVIFAWSFVAYREVGTGHYVEDGHQVVSTGPYALVRHPMYCAAVFIWLGLSLATADWALLTFTFAYVVPAYYFYAKEEEQMMSRELGANYESYVARVPMLFPRPLNIWE